MSAPRRVRTIYSVIASPNRLDILRILNTKGPLSYSELKTLAGFKSKKESGKFAYHLRKLVKQTLIALNRAERKYAVTSLGRLVLNLTRQIEEQSMLESGRLYVRSSRQAMEEFNADRILQSLVNEAEMPVELAQKIASETEARVYKFQAAYLTAPLIREVVNSILVEHGYEEYRHKLTRLGLPVFDVSDLVEKTADGQGAAGSIFSQTSNRVLAEYVLLTKLPRDVSDAHLQGDIHLSSLGTWGLMPDTLYFDLASLYTGVPNIGSKVMHLPRFGPVKSFDSAMECLHLIAGLLTKEVSNEVCLDNLIPFLSRLMAPGSQDEQIRLFSNVLCTLSSILQEGSFARLTFRLSEPQKDREDISTQLELRDSLLSAYTKFVRSVPRPLVNLVVSPGRYFDRNVTDGVANIIAEGGDVALESEGKFCFSGLRLDRLTGNGSSEAAPEGLAVLENITLNLPRLAYESNKDETYFRARLAILVQTAITSLSSRKGQVKDVMRKGLLPTVTQLPVLSSMDEMPCVINLMGLNEAISGLVSEKEQMTNQEIALRALDTACKVSWEKGEKLGLKTYVSLVHQEGADRLAELDSERYGKSRESRGHGYQSGLSILADHFDNDQVVSSLAGISRQTNGGALLSFEFPRLKSETFSYGAIVNGAYGKLPFSRMSRNPEICKKCSSKVFGTGRCPNCKSTSLIASANLMA